MSINMYRRCFCIVFIVYQCGQPVMEMFVYFTHGNSIGTSTFWLVSISRAISIGKQFATKIKSDTFCLIDKQSYLEKKRTHQSLLFRWSVFKEES